MHRATLPESDPVTFPQLQTLPNGTHLPCFPSSNRTEYARVIVLLITTLQRNRYLHSLMLFRNVRHAFSCSLSLSDFALSKLVLFVVKS